MDMLDHFLGKFYQRRVQGTNEIYDISRDSKGLLLLYVLIVAVLAEDGEMTSETFESLRECLRMASIEVVSRLRYVFTGLVMLRQVTKSRVCTIRCKSFRRCASGRYTYRRTTHISINLVAWPSGLRRQLKALVLRGAGSNPAAAICFCVGGQFFCPFTGVRAVRKLCPGFF